MNEQKSRYTRQQIYEGVRNVLVEALGVDKEEAVEDARLMEDLGAESIDYLDIRLRLEKRFNIITNDGLYSSGLEYALTESDGSRTISAENILELRRNFPDDNLDGIEEGMNIDVIAQRQTVGYTIDYVVSKLREEERFVEGGENE